MKIRSFREAARELGIDRAWITALAKAGQIPTVDHPYSRKARGLDEAGFARLRQITQPAASTAST